MPAASLESAYEDHKVQPFFIVGAARAGTTTLADLLGSHPDISMSRPKEPRFFELEYDAGREFYLDTYHQHWSGESFIGDARARHLLLPFVPSRIRTLFPDAKIVVILRDPVRRAFSDWWMQHGRGLDPASFEQAIEDNFDRLENGPQLSDKNASAIWGEHLESLHAGRGPQLRTYIDEGYYAEHLARYASVFGEDRLFVTFLSDLAESQTETVHAICEFLDADVAAGGSENGPRNASLSPFGYRLMRIAKRINLDLLLPESLKTWGYELLTSFGDRPEISTGLSETLGDHFQGRNEDLSGFLGRSLPESWYGPARHGRTRDGDHSSGEGGSS